MRVVAERLRPTLHASGVVLLSVFCLLPSRSSAELAVFDSLRVAGRQVAVLEQDGIAYVPLPRLVQVLGGRFWRVQERYVVILPPLGIQQSANGVLDSGTPMPDREYVLWADSGIVRCADQEFRLPFEPVASEGQMCLPVIGLDEVFPELAHLALPFDRVEIGEAGDTVVVRFKTRGSAGHPNRVSRPGEGRFDSAPVQWRGESRSSLEYRLVIGARHDSAIARQVALVPILAENGLVQAVRIESCVGTAFRFLFRRPAVATSAREPDGVTVRISPRPLHRIRRVVLDPGHGGKDPGAVGRAGTLEKTIVLDVAKRLERSLCEQGLEVMLTRSRDEYVPLGVRSKLANEKKADLFLSIHANASPNRDACGFETYFLSEAKSDWERAVAARENAALELEGLDPVRVGDELELILADLAQNEFLTESSELAAAIQERTVPGARIKNRGVRQAGFFVLRDTYMPAVLVECGFISNRSEEKLLLNTKHRQRLADGISKGILEFIKVYERRLNGT